MKYKGTITWTTALLLMLTVLTAAIADHYQWPPAAGPAGHSSFQDANHGSTALTGDHGWQSHQIAQLRCVTGDYVQARNEHLMDGPSDQDPITEPDADIVALAPANQLTTLQE